MNDVAGRWFTVGTGPDDRRVTLPLRHTLVLGHAGSGRSVLCSRIGAELLASGVAVFGFGLAPFPSTAFHRIGDPPSTDALSDLEALCSKTDAEPAVVIVDETEYAFPDLFSVDSADVRDRFMRLRDMFDNLMSTGRSRNVAVMAATQGTRLPARWPMLFENSVILGRPGREQCDLAHVPYPPPQALAGPGAGLYRVGIRTADTFNALPLL